MDRKRNRHGIGSMKEGKESLKHLKNKYENTENRSSYDFAKKLIEKNIPESLKGLVDILARLVTRTTRKNELGLACKMVGKLIVYEIENAGYNIRNTKYEANGHNRHKTVWVWKNFSDERNIFKIVNCEISYPTEKAEGMKREFEKKFLDRYGLNIKLDPLT